MFNIAFWIVIGLLIGWNFPQPAFAKNLQDRFIMPLVDWVRNKF